MDDSCVIIVTSVARTKRGMCRKTNPSNENVAKANRVMFGNLEGGVRRGMGGNDKEWIDCVQSNVQPVGIAGGWKTTALEAGVKVETVTEGGRRFTASWSKEEEDAARHRQAKREAIGTRKVIIVQRSVEPANRHQNSLHETS